MRKIALMTPVLLLSACGETEAEKAARAADYAKIVQSTCFLSGFGPGRPQHEECVRVVGESMAAMRRLTGVAEDEARRFEMQMEFARNMAEGFRETGRGRGCS